MVHEDGLIAQGATCAESFKEDEDAVWFRCSHSRSVDYYIESLQGRCQFVGTQCDSYGTDFLYISNEVKPIRASCSNFISLQTTLKTECATSCKTRKQSWLTTPTRRWRPAATTWTRIAPVRFANYKNRIFTLKTNPF